MASTVIYRDSVSTGHNKFTFSAWVKRGSLTTLNTTCKRCFKGIFSKY